MMRRWRRIALAAVALVALLGVGEAVARWALGLGDPPLTVRDPQIEYLFAPSRTYRRFGNVIHYNAWSMRSDDFPMRKDRADELRVLILGDSVVNGGVLSDQSAIGSSILQRDLRAGGLNARVGNISAGSWGPENLLAYVGRYGWFDADIAIIVVSTHDLADIRTFAADLGPDFPEATPPSALWEAVTRYLPRFLPVSLRPPAARPPAAPAPEALAAGSAALKGLLMEASAQVQHVAVVIHPARDEPLDASNVQRAALMDIVRASGVPMIDASQRMRAADGSNKLYRDTIHPNDAGQHEYADLFSCIVKALLDHRDLLSCELQPGQPSRRRSPSMRSALEPPW